MNGYDDQKTAQVAIEYLLMLAAVVVVVLVAIPKLLPRVQEQSENFFNTTAVEIMGNHAAEVGGVGKARTHATNYP